MKATFKTPDFRKFIAQLEKVGEDKLEEIRDEIKDSADQIVLMAKSYSPINEGRLRNSISNRQVDPFVYEVVAQTNYAAFMEFGTRSQVNIPPGAEEIAAEAQKFSRQNKGSIQDMERSIRRWVRLKGLAGTYSTKTRKRVGSKKQQSREDDQLVFLIMRKILKIGVKPQPFFYPAIQNETPKLEKKLRTILKK